MEKLPGGVAGREQKQFNRDRVMFDAREIETLPGARGTWSIVVVCEDESAHSKALSACNRLISQFWTEFEFAVRWYQFSNLQDPETALTAASAAANADIVVFTIAGDDELPAHVKSWVES